MKDGYWKEDWDLMYLIYASPTSKTAMSKWDTPEMRALKMTSTGMLETHLINQWHSHPSCVNRHYAGGACPSDGSPHFTHIVAKANFPDLFDYEEL